MTFRGTSIASSGFKLDAYLTTRWIELNPTADLPSGTTTIPITAFTNTPYVLSSGIQFTLQLWQNGHFINQWGYSPTATANPNVVLEKSLSPVVVTIKQ
jgi:hypothetical protein